MKAPENDSAHFLLLGSTSCPSSRRLLCGFCEGEVIFLFCVSETVLETAIRNNISPVPTSIQVPDTSSRSSVHHCLDCCVDDDYLMELAGLQLVVGVV